MTVTEQWLGDIPWLVVRGERLAACQALGEHTREHIQAAVEELPDFETLRRRLGNPAVARQHVLVADETQRRYPKEWAELAAMARGARVDFDDLLLMNLRGDLGTEDGTGCSDLGYVGHGEGFIAHNEDGSAAQHGRFWLLTLIVDGDVPVTIWWYPGFVPANTFVITANGLAWGIDHIGVRRPAAAPSRHFVARAAQQESTMDDVVRHLTTNPCAGGFAYTIGRVGHAEISVVETAAGLSHATNVGSFSWHTNHLRNLPAELETWYENSVERGRFLGGLRVPERPDTAWFLEVLAGALLPHGVLRDGENDMLTSATFVVDLVRAQVTVLPRGGPPSSLPAADLSRGVARSASPR